MKILFELISAFLYFNAMSPVFMYYIYDENPIEGFVALENAAAAYVKTGFSSNGKKQFTGSYNPKYQKFHNEHILDSHFKVMKTPSNYNNPTILDNGRLKAHVAVQNNAQRIAEEYKNTEAPKQWQQKIQQQQIVNTANSGQQEHQNSLVKIQASNNPPIKGEYTVNATTKEAVSLTQPANNQQIPPIRPKAVNVDYSNQMKQRSQKNQDGGFEPKPSFVKINVRKTQISTDPQKILRLNNNRQLSSLSVHTSQDKRQRKPTSMMMDEPLHKTNGLHDHNMQLMSRVLDDMTQKMLDRRTKKGEYTKRDTTKSFELYENSKRSVISENMKKYIGKDKTVVGQHKNNIDLSRIGSHEESLQANETPYALFYKMNPGNLDHKEGFILMSSMEINTSDVSSKEKRFATAFEIATEIRSQQKGMKNGNPSKARKTLKNFSSHRNH